MSWLGKYIDHTLLKAQASETEVLSLCSEAIKYHCKSVCVNSTWVSTACNALKGSTVIVCTVVGFPLGASTTITKVTETLQAIVDGATEIDMVINIGALKSSQSDVHT